MLNKKRFYRAEKVGLRYNIYMLLTDVVVCEHVSKGFIMKYGMNHRISYFYEGRKKREMIQFMA